MSKSSDNSDDDQNKLSDYDVNHSGIKNCTCEIPNLPSESKDECNCQLKINQKETSMEAGCNTDTLPCLTIKFPVDDVLKLLRSRSPGNPDTYLSLQPYYQRRALQTKMRVLTAKVKTAVDKKFRNYISTNNLSMVKKFLLEERVDVNSYDDKKRTPLHIASSKGYPAMALLLLAYLADPNMKDVNGNTPLHLATCSAHLDVVTILLRAGTNVELCDNAGYSPFSLAKARLQTLRYENSISGDCIKDRVQQIIDMIKAYLMIRGIEMDTKLLNDFNKLSVSSSDKDVEQNVDGLLQSLESLNLNKDN